MTDHLFIIKSISVKTGVIPTHWYTDRLSWISVHMNQCVSPSRARCVVERRMCRNGCNVVTVSFNSNVSGLVTRSSDSCNFCGIRPKKTASCSSNLQRAWGQSMKTSGWIGCSRKSTIQTIRIGSVTICVSTTNCLRFKNEVGYLFVSAFPKMCAEHGCKRTIQMTTRATWRIRNTAPKTRWTKHARMCLHAPSIHLTKASGAKCWILWYKSASTFTQAPYPHWSKVYTLLPFRFLVAFCVVYFVQFCGMSTCVRNALVYFIVVRSGMLQAWLFRVPACYKPNDYPKHNLHHSLICPYFLIQPRRPSTSLLTLPQAITSGTIASRFDRQTFIRSRSWTWRHLGTMFASFGDRHVDK